MILLLGTLVLILFKDSLGSLQQNTVLNGTFLDLKWNVRMPVGETFFVFKIFEGSYDRELAIITEKSTIIRNPLRLKGRVFEDSKSDFNTVPMAFHLKIGPIMMDDDGLIILYQLIDTNGADVLKGQDNIDVKTSPTYCDAAVQLNDNYLIQSNASFILPITVCCDPIPTVEWIFADWVVNEQSVEWTTLNYTENNKQKFLSKLMLKNVDMRNCGRKIYFNATNGYLPDLIGETTINITGTPGKVTGIKAEEINAVSNCVRVSFNKVDVGLCEISYQVRFVFQNARELSINTISTMFQLCDASLVNTTVNVAALFNGNLGPYNDANVNINERSPSVNVARKELTYKFGVSSVVGSFFGGVFLTIVAECVVYIVKRYCADISPDISVYKANADNIRPEDSAYTELDNVHSIPGDYAVPSHYTEMSKFTVPPQ